jgi:hypothetical protein
MQVAIMALFLNVQKKTCLNTGDCKRWKDVEKWFFKGF